jgi:hypothetical protein
MRHPSGHEYDLSELDERFTPFYESGQRVEVEWLDGYEDYSGYGALTDGKKARFTVGKSTGWKPVYLQIYSKRSSGGQEILSSAVKSIRAIN